MATTYKYTEAKGGENVIIEFNPADSMYKVSGDSSVIFEIKKDDIEKISNMINADDIIKLGNVITPTTQTVSTAVFSGPGSGHGLEVLTQNSTIDEILTALPALRGEAYNYINNLFFIYPAIAAAAAAAAGTGNVNKLSGIDHKDSSDIKLYENLKNNNNQLARYVYFRLRPMLILLIPESNDANAGFIDKYIKVKDTVEKIKTKIPSYNQWHDDYNSDIFNKMNETEQSEVETKLNKLLDEMQQLFENVNILSGQPKRIGKTVTAVSTLYKEKDFGTLNEFSKSLNTTDIQLPDEITILVKALTFLVNKLPVYFNKMLSTYGVLSRTFNRNTSLSKEGTARTTNSYLRSIAKGLSITSRNLATPGKLNVDGDRYIGGNNKTKKKTKKGNGHKQYS